MDQIAARLTSAILEGRYAPGERLPPERELASHWGASRGSVREVLRRLDALGLVSRRIGSGTFVTLTPPDPIAERTSPLELIEVRLTLEPRAAQLAVANATARDLAQLRAALEGLEAASSDREAFSRADEHFHLCVVECTHNPLMIWLYHHINDIRSHDQWNRMKDKILTRERIAAYNLEHRQLHEALRSRDAAAAARVLEAHLERARRDLVGARRDSNARVSQDGAPLERAR